MTFAFRWIALSLAFAGSLMADAGFNTIGVWNGSTFISSFGVVNTASYAQTITINTATPVTSFGFEIGNCGASVTLRGEIYAWDAVNSKATGSALYESAPTAIPNGSFQPVSFAPTGLTLAPGTYVLFITTTRDQTGAPTSGCRVGSVDQAAYAGGSFYFTNNGTDPTLWTTAAWTHIASNLAFQVNTPNAGSGTPLPSTLLLGLAGLMAVGLFGLLYRRWAAAS